MKMEENKKAKLEVSYLKKKNEFKKENSNEKINLYLMEACGRSVLTLTQRKNSKK